MTQNEEKVTAQDLIQQIDEFEKTILKLNENVAILRKKLAAKQAQYGDDVSQWPQQK
ncbi:MAG: hypothetical protein WC901_00035 [Candidatus Margulisiibacteriota bacterium]